MLDELVKSRRDANNNGKSARLVFCAAMERSFAISFKLMNVSPCSIDSGDRPSDANSPTGSEPNSRTVSK